MDGDVVSNDTDTWRVNLLFPRPHDAAVTLQINGVSKATEASHSQCFADSAYGTPVITGTACSDIVPLRTFYLQLDLQVATSWAGSISWMPF